MECGSKLFSTFFYTWAVYQIKNVSCARLLAKRLDELQSAVLCVNHSQTVIKCIGPTNSAKTINASSSRCLPQFSWESLSVKELETDTTRNMHTFILCFVNLPAESATLINQSARSFSTLYKSIISRKTYWWHQKRQHPYKKETESSIYGQRLVPPPPVHYCKLWYSQFSVEAQPSHK